MRRVFRLKLEEKKWQESIGGKTLNQFHRRPGTRYIFSQQVRRLLDWVPQLYQGVVMEIGYGHGYLLTELRKKLGTKVNLMGLELARPSTLVRQRLRGVNLIEADGESLPIRSRSIDVLIYMGSLHHLPDYARAIGEMARVLKKTGRVIIFEPFSTPFTRLVHSVMDKLFFQGGDYESPIDLACKDSFRLDVVVKKLRKCKLKIVTIEWKDFLAYTLTSCYKGGGWSKSVNVAKSLFALERFLWKLPGINRIWPWFCWRALVIAHPGKKPDNHW